MTERDDKTRAAVIADTHAWRLARVVETLQNHGYTDGPEWVRNAAQEIERLRAALAILGEDCETCKGDPNVCATVPGLRHCEKANREPATSSSADQRRLTICKDHQHADWNQPALEDDACILCRLFYLEAQESLLEEWQQRAKRAEATIAEIQRPLDAQMSRLNETVVRLNDENERLRATTGSATERTTDPYKRNPTAGQCKCGGHTVPAGCDGVQWYWQRHGRDACTLELPNLRCWCGLLRHEHVTGHKEGVESPGQSAVDGSAVDTKKGSL